MKKTRALALLLILTLLTAAMPALGEAPDLLYDILQEGPGAEETPDDRSEELLSDLADGEGQGLQPNAAPSQQDFALFYEPGETVDNDLLFAGYVDRLFGKKDSLGLKPNGIAGDQLTGVSAKVFKYLLKQVKAVAAGELASTRFDIPAEIASESDIQALCDSYSLIIHALLADCPYDLYWYNKVVTTEFGYRGGFYFCFPVAQEYAAGDYRTDANRIRSVRKAADNARALVKREASKSDYTKLYDYMEYICGRVSYNDSVLSDPRYPYGNPWQLIWVFDDDPGTNVVCEGYAKAFQYLCDLSKFKSAIRCISVTGRVPRGAHMWNIVTMEDGKNYVADPTFSDTGSNRVFLAGAESTGRYEYTYDSSTLGLFPASALKLSAADYAPKPTKITVSPGKNPKLYMGNTLTLQAKLTPLGAKADLKWSSSDVKVARVSSKGVVTPKKEGTATITVRTKGSGAVSATVTVKVLDAASVTLKNGKAKLTEGKTVRLKPGKSLTLTAAVKPDKVKTRLTWKSSSKLVTVKNGIVTVKKTARAGHRAQITVSTANKVSSYIYIEVE